MNFDIDVLIIFSDKDNEDNQQAGWVSQFKKFLEQTLTQITGSKPRVLLKSEFDSITSPKLDNAAVLISILSSNFAQSGRCLESLETFCKAAEKSGINHNRVFKVFKSPLRLSEQPDRIRELLGYNMYQTSTTTMEAKENAGYFGSDAEKNYWMKLVNLAYDIAEALDQLKGNSPQPEVKSIFKRKTIYLAETGQDLSVQRSIMRRELMKQGYEVLPSQTFPSKFADLDRIIRRDMETADLSIHLIGIDAGEIPEGTDRSVTDIQNQIASEKSQRVGKTAFKRLVWVSPNLTQASEKHKAFIDNLKRDLESQESSELLQIPIEDFKNIVREELANSREKQSIDESDTPSIYLVYDRIDTEEVKPIISALERSGYMVLTPEFDGDLMQLRQHHINNLRRFDSAIIYKGKVNDQWVNMKVLDMQKAPGFGRNKPIKGKAILAVGDQSFDKEKIKSQNIRVVVADAKEAVNAVKSLLQEFESA